jgi:hypothetical protein
MSRTFTIDGEAVLVSPRWRISDKINARTTLSVTVIDLLDLTTIDIGDPITVTNNAITIFSGIVSTIDISETYPGILEYDLKCIDNSALADKRLIAETGTDETAGYIAEHVILPYLAEEGVTAGTIEAGITISKYTFNYITASQALDQIKTISGLNWNIDKNKQLNLFSRSSYLAPWTLTDNVQHTRFKQSKSIDQYRNVQYVRAGKAKTATQTLEKPSPKPDGVSKTFRTKYPVAQKPTITINSTPVNSDDVGIKALDTGKKWYFAYDSNDIIQDNSETILSDADVLEITYIGLYDILVLAEYETEIEARAIAETGTSGRYEHITEEKSITEADEAQEYGEGLLSKYAEIADNIAFETNVTGLEAGQLLTVNKTLFGLSGSFLIESIDISADSPSEVVYSVKALDGAALGGWEQYFKDILKLQKTYVINENEALIKVRKHREVITLTDTLTFPETEMGNEIISLTDALIVTGAGVESRVGHALVGYSEVGA